MTFDRNLTYYLEKAQMSEYTLARLIGVDVEEVFKWEKNQRKPDAQTLHFIACALNIPDENLTDPGALPEKPPAKEEVKHEHAAFDGGVLGQPEGIYGTSDKESKAASASTTMAATTSATAAKPASKPMSKPVFASDSENTLWRGSSKHVNQAGAVRNVFIIIFFFIFAMIVFGNVLPDAAGVLVVALIIALIVNSKKTGKTISKEYKLTDRKIRISTDGSEYTIPLSDVAGIRIVGEDADGKGSIIINVLGQPEIKTLPTVDSAKPISVIYDIKSVRHVFSLINEAYYSDKKRRESINENKF